MKDANSILLIFFLLITSFGCRNDTREIVDSGYAKNNIGDYNGAIADYTNAIAINPKDADAYYLRGLVKITSLGQKESGCLDLVKSRDLGQTEAFEAIKKYCQSIPEKYVRSFKVNGVKYNIPVLEAQAFLADFPKAKEIRSYVLGKDTLDIPVEEIPDFIKVAPNAQYLYNYLPTWDECTPIVDQPKLQEFTEFVPPEVLAKNKETKQSKQDQINKMMGKNIIMILTIFLSGLFLVVIIWIFNKLLKMKQIKNAEPIDFEKELLNQPGDQFQEMANVSKGFICSNCGSAIPKDTKFCSICGSPNSNVFQTIKTKTIDLESFERLATFKERLLAKLIDFFFLIVIMTFALPAILEYYPEYPQNQWILMIVGTVITILYHSIWLSSSYQATPGRFLKHLQVVRTNSKAISFPFAVLRDLAEWITCATFFIGYLLMLLNKDKMTLHDYLVSTIVVKRKPDIKKESIYFHYRNIVYLGYGGILMGFFTIFLSGKTMNEVDKIGGYIGGVVSVYAILLVVLFFKYLKKIMTGKWTNSQYNITWPIFFVILASYIYNTINP